MYAKSLYNGKITRYANVIKLTSGRFAVETKDESGKFEINMNIPIFDDGKSAHDYLIKNGFIIL